MRIKEIREAKGQKQKDLANALGIAANTLSQYECGKREPDLETTKRIAECLGVTIDYLLGTKQKETPPSQLAGGANDSDNPEYVELKNMLENIKSGKSTKYAYIIGFDGERDFTKVDEEEYQSLKTFLEVHRAMKEKERQKLHPTQE